MAKPMDVGEDQPPFIDNEFDSMPDLHDPTQNLLLAALSPPERERVYPHLQRVPMALGRVLYESGDVLRHVYFPTDSIISLLYVMEDGASAEISVVGNEGLIGVALFMARETTPSRAIVQSAGSAYGLVGQRLKKEFHRNGAMQLLLLRYTQALLTQMAQTAVCNRHHSLRSWADHGGGQAPPGTALLRVLCRGQEGDRSPPAAAARSVPVGDGSGPGRHCGRCA